MHTLRFTYDSIMSCVGVSQNMFQLCLYTWHSTKRRHAYIRMNNIINIHAHVVLYMLKLTQKLNCNTNIIIFIMCAVCLIC